MKIEKIKPIPKYIQKKIKLYDDKLKTAPFGRTRFYAYFTKNDGELVKVTSGPFAGMEGKIESLDLPNQVLTVLLDLFGQETSVEVEISQIEKA